MLSIYLWAEAPEATQGSGGRISKRGTFTLLGKQAKGNFLFSGRNRLAVFINLISITGRCTQTNKLTCSKRLSKTIFNN